MEHSTDGVNLFDMNPFDMKPLAMNSFDMKQFDPAVFKPLSPWWGGDLQTLRNTVLGLEAALPSPSKRLTIELRDGSGDKMLAMLNEPPARRAPANRPGVGGGNEQTPDDKEPNERPLVVLIHGLTGCEDSAYMRATAAFQLGLGRRVLRLNLRGAGPSRTTCRGHYHAGCADDIAAALNGLSALAQQDELGELGEQDRDPLANGVLLIGYSLGGNVLLNFLAKYGGDFAVLGAATVSAPIEPAQASKRLMAARNFLYHRWLLGRMRDEAGAPGAGVSGAERAAIAGAKTIWDYDDRFIAPRFGFDGARDYYTRIAGAGKVQQITVPTLLVHAQNDPWIPVTPYRELEKSCPENVKILLPTSGGHVGFHGADDEVSWHDRAIETLFCGLDPSAP